METKTCPVCGHKIAADATYCIFCAAREKRNAMKPCPVCGYMIPDGATSCPACAWRERYNAMKTCPVCGYKIPEGAASCPACAWRERYNAMKTCPVCGHKIPDGSASCIFCAGRERLNKRKTILATNNTENTIEEKITSEEHENAKAQSIVSNITKPENVSTEDHTVSESLESGDVNYISEKKVMITDSPSFEDRNTPEDYKSIDDNCSSEKIITATELPSTEGHSAAEGLECLEDSCTPDTDVTMKENAYIEEPDDEQYHEEEELNSVETAPATETSESIEEDLSDQTHTSTESAHVTEDISSPDENIEVVEAELIEYQEGQRTELTTELGNTFFFELSNDWQLQNGDQFLSTAQKEQAYRILSDVNEMQRVAPSLYGIISNMAKEEHVLIAKLDQYTEKLVKEGKLWFSVDKNGELLPTVRNSKHIVKQVRLTEWKKQPTVGNPQFVTDIYTQLVLTKILHEVKALNSTIDSIRADLHNDRVAKADSAISLYKQALASNQVRKEEQLKTAASSATLAKSVLMREVETKLNYVVNNVGQGLVDRLFDEKGDNELETSSTYIMNDLVSILQMVDIECSVHRHFGDDGAIQECLSQYLDFVARTGLDKRDTLLKINECLPVPVNEAISKYCSLTSNIYVYQKTDYIEQKGFTNYMLNTLQKPDSIKVCKTCNRELPNDTETTVCEYCARRKSKNIRTTGKTVAGISTVAGSIFMGKSIIKK